MKIKKYIIYIIIAATIFFSSCSRAAVMPSPMPLPPVTEQEPAPPPPLPEFENNDAEIASDINPDLVNPAEVLVPMGASITMPNSVGNSVANLSGGGRMAFQGIAAYYANADEGNVLYKRLKTETKKLSDKTANHINVVDRTVYFITRFKEFMAVDINGENERLILDKPVDNLVVAGNDAYYCSVEDGYSVYRYDLENKTEQLVTGAAAIHLHYHDGYLYFQTYVDNTTMLMRKDLESGKEEKVTNLVESCTAIAFAYDRIFYRAVVKVNGSVKYRLYSMNLDGSDNKMLSANEPHCINVVNGFVLYSNKDHGNRLYSINIDGTGGRKVNDNPIENIYCDYQTAYFRSLTPDEDYKLI